MIRNTEEFLLADKKTLVGFRTGTMAIAVACENCGVNSTEELYDKLAQANVKATLSLFYGSAIQYFQWKHPEIKDFPFNMTQVSEWIEDLGEAEGARITTSLLKSYLPKNFQPPQETGASQEQPSMIGSTSQLQKAV